MAIDADIVIRADEPIRMTNDDPINDGNVSSLITLEETPSGGTSAEARPFTATINNDKRVITIDPTGDFANDATVSMRLAQVEDEAGNASEVLDITFRVVPSTVDITARTDEVETAILAAVAATDPSAIPFEQLAAITSLTVSGLSSLMANDFASLSGLTVLDISGNSGLTTLPNGIFDDILDTLTTLTVDNARKATVEFSPASEEIEQDSTIMLSVSLSQALPTAVHIPYVVSFGGSGPPTQSDFSGLADGMVEFAAGSTTAQIISVTAAAGAPVDGTATLTLGAPILTVDIRTSGRLDAASLVSLTNSPEAHTFTVVPVVSSFLSVTDPSVAEEAGAGDPGSEATFTLALADLPVTGTDDVSVFYTVSGFAITSAMDIGSSSAFVTRLNAFANPDTDNINLMPSTDATAGAGRIDLDRTATPPEITGDGSSTVLFVLRLQKDDDNQVNETITLTIDCVARSRTGRGAPGCTSAGDDNILIASSAVGDNGASITAFGDVPFERIREREFNTLSAAGNGNSSGIWSDGTTMWVADALDDKIYAYSMSDKSRDSTRDFDTLSAVGNNAPSGIWSDGTTMWVADNGADKIYAYNMSDKSYDSTRDFNTLNAAGNNNPIGIWSDGTTMWVADSSDGKIYAYNMTTKNYDSARDFNTLSAAGNNNPIGIWSDGTTMWVADALDDNIYAYNMSDKSYDSTRDFDTLDAAGNNNSLGIWSDGTTMWVADFLDDKIYAYRLP